MSYAYERIPPSPDRASWSRPPTACSAPSPGRSRRSPRARDGGPPPPDEPARHRARARPTGAHPGRHAAPRARTLLLDRAPAHPRHRAPGVRHERLLREQLDRRHPQRARRPGRSGRGARWAGCATATRTTPRGSPRRAGTTSSAGRSASGASSAGGPGSAPTTAASAATPTCPAST